MYALLRREEERRRAAPVEAILDLLEPVVLIAVMSVASWFLARRNASMLGGPAVLFYSTGFFALYFFIYLSKRMRGSVPSPRRRFPVERRLDHIVVHIMIKVFDYAILGVLLFGTLYVFFTAQAFPQNFIPIIQACAAIIMLGFGWGITNLVLGRVWWVWPYVEQPLSRCLILFTGVLFLVDFLSPTARYVLSFVPLVHGISLFRLGFYPNYPTLVLDVGYLYACAVFAVVFGLVIERVSRRNEP
jgi:capsular polysaccharide transport system permease protein